MPIIVLLLAGTTVAALSSAKAERQKRAQLQAYYANMVSVLSSRIAELEELYGVLTSRLSVHEQQVRRLAVEIERLRGELAFYQYAAAA